MGCSLSSLHLYTDDTLTSLPQGLSVRVLSPHWLSVEQQLPPEDSERLARSLSKTTGLPVLWFDYFDNDEMTLKLYIAGKTAAGFWGIPSRGDMKSKITNFASLLDFSNEDKKAIRNILQCETPALRIELLEEFFGLSLLIPQAPLNEEEAAGYRKEKGNTRYTQYLTERKQATRIQNHTRMTLVFEEELVLTNHIFGSPTLFAHYYYAYRPIENHIYDEYFSPMQEVHFTGGTLTPAQPNEGLPDPTRPEDRTELQRRIGHTHQRSIEGIDSAGQILWTRPIPEHESLCAPPFSDGSFVWLLIYNKNDNIGYFLKLNELTGEEVQCTLHKAANNPYYSFFCYHNGNLYADHKNEQGECEYIEMDTSLRILRTCPKMLHFLGEPSLISDGRAYFTCWNDLDIGYFDMDTMRCSVARLPAQYFPHCANPDGSIWALSEGSSVCLLSKDLQLLSLHKLKGIPIDLHEGHILTQQGEIHNWGEPKRCYVRIYRIEDTPLINNQATP